MKSSAFKFKRFTFFVAKNRDKQWVVIKKYWGDLVHWKLYTRVYVLTQLHLKFFRVLSRGTSSRSFRASWLVVGIQSWFHVTKGATNFLYSAISYM